MDPAATVTEGGRLAAVGFPLVSPMVKPPAGAACVSVIKSIVGAPPVTLGAVRLTPESDAVLAGGLTESVANLETVPIVAVNCT